MQTWKELSCIRQQYKSGGNTMLLIIGIIIGFGLGYLAGMDYHKHKDKHDKKDYKNADT